MTAAILTDLTRCIGCGACTLKCKETNGLRYSEVDNLDAYTWCSISKQKGLFVKRQCMHCEEPTCASVCPVGALHKTDLGPVVYDVDKCFGCRYCVMACPFKIPKYQWDTPLPRVGKCVMCYEKRLKEHRQPACTEVCPAGASMFGERDELIAKARDRIKSNPGRYVQEIYGEHTAGGTHVMYISSIPFDQLGFPGDVLNTAYPALTWQVLSKIPHIVSIGGLSLLTVYWLVGRRIKLQQKALAAASGAGAPGGDGEGGHS
jgi:formate dehydrogenase iron-sulfur subunit